ncbi:MAG: type II toxin-antitoxin system RelE family toxin [Anaerolineales bacterium]
MAEYTVRLLKTASRELEALDKPIARRLVARINWLAINLDQAKPIPLKGELRGLYKLREGDYRIIYEVIHAESVVIIHSLGHRREIYKRR